MNTTRRQFVLGALSLPAAAQSSRVPQIGFYQWSGAPPTADTDLLSQTLSATIALGCPLLRVYAGGRYDYQHPIMSPRRFSGWPQPPRTLVDIVSAEPYRAVLNAPSLETIILTAYSVADYGAGPAEINLQRPWGTREEEIEYSQISELCAWLYEHYGRQDKTVIISNSEADVKLLDIANYTGDIGLAVANLRAWTHTRHEAIRATRQRHPNARLRIVHAFEVSMVNLMVVQDGPRFRKGLRPSPASARQVANALGSVVPHVTFDLLSYSSYESVNSPYQSGDIDTPPAELTQRLSRDIAQLSSISAKNVSAFGRREFPHGYVMIGEVGFARDRFEPLSSGGVLARFDAALQAARQLRCPYFVIWQMFDAPRDGRTAWGFGAIDRLGRHPPLEPVASGMSTLYGWARKSVVGR